MFQLLETSPFSQESCLKFHRQKSGKGNEKKRYIKNQYCCFFNINWNIFGLCDEHKHELKDFTYSFEQWFPCMDFSNFHSFMFFLYKFRVDYAYKKSFLSIKSNQTNKNHKINDIEEEQRQAKKLNKRNTLEFPSSKNGKKYLNCFLMVMGARNKTNKLTNKKTNRKIHCSIVWLMMPFPAHINRFLCKRNKITLNWHCRILQLYHQPQSVKICVYKKNWKI